MGFLKDKQAKPISAIRHLKEAFEIGKKLHLFEIIYQSAQGIANIQARQNNFAEAYRFRTLENQYYDSLYRQNQAIEIKKLERQQSLKAIKQEFENEYALEIMKSEIKQKRQRRTIILLSSGILIALIAIFFFYRQKKWVGLKNKALSESNERIKESEQFVLQSLNRTRALLDNSIVGIALITSDGLIKQVNNTLCKSSGYTEDELVNQTVDIFYKDETQRREVINLRDAAFKKHQTFEYEGVFYSKNNKPIPVHLSGRPLNFDVCEEIVWVIRDMSQLKQTQLQLNWFERFVESSNQGLAMASLDGDLVYLNPYMETLFGAMNIKKTIYNSYPTSMQVKLSKEVIPTVLKEGSWQGELKQQTLSGELINTLEHFFILKNEHGHAAYIADIITDITHLKKMETELYNANKAKDQLFSIIGHDLRSPLGTLDSMLQLLLTNIQTMERERLHNIIENLQASASETYALLENLLFWARGQQNKMQVTPVVLNAHRITSNVRNLLKNNALIKNIKFTIDVPEDLSLKADEIMTSTIIRNLVTNAIKFTPEGGKIHIEARAAEQEIRFRVTDTGIGIPAADIPRLFDENEFYTSIGTQNEAGTGIGLVLCHRFVKANGGEIWVNSDIGKGTTFFFTLPKA
jgi:PAS domain S-box-containing protein